MKKYVALLASASSLATLLAMSIAAEESDFPVIDESIISRKLAFNGQSDRTLDVRAISGSIRVMGTDQADVQLEVRRTVRAATKEELAEAERDVVLGITDGAARIDVIASERGERPCDETLNRRSGQWRRPRYIVRHDVDIQVPRDTRLRLCTVNGGDIVVDGTRGDFEVDNVNGRITMADVSGQGSARTVNGSIVAVFTEQPRAQSEFKTINGDLIVRLPADLGADLRMKSFNGALLTDFDVQALPQPLLVGERRGGGFVYRSDQFSLMRVGRGGPELTFDTFNGSVHVLRAEK